MLNYSDIFDQAFELYKTQANRPGYTFGWFSWLRHSRKPNARTDELHNALKNNSNPKETLIRFFSTCNTPMNNHSFATYLLDQLAKNDNTHEWDQYYPKQKQVLFFYGILYRGSLQSGDDACENGIYEVEHSNRIEDYADDTNRHVGISTSKNKEVAATYQTTVIPTARGAFHKVGNLFEINFRRGLGVDIPKTLERRQEIFTKSYSDRKDEVNVLGHIDKEDIKGYWDNYGIYHPNKNYQQERYIDKNNCLTFIEKLTNFFSPNPF